jgi:hypothetical protein
MHSAHMEKAVNCYGSHIPRWGETLSLCGSENPNTHTCMSPYWSECRVARNEAAHLSTYACTNAAHGRFLEQRWINPAVARNGHSQ